MTRFLKISILTMLCVFLIAGTAMAGTIMFTGGANTPITVALEAMNAARSFTLGTQTVTNPIGVNQASISIQPNVAFSSTDLLTVTFSGAGFLGDSVSLCAVGTNVPIATSLSTANNTSLLFHLTGNAPAGTQVFITDDPVQNVAVNGCNGANGTLAIKFLATTSAQFASVTYADISSGSTPIDSAAGVANIANIAQQFATNYSVGTSTIDYITGAANGSQFSGSTNAATGGNASIGYVSKTIQEQTVTPPFTVSAILSLQDSANWQAVKDVYVSGPLGCTATGFATAAGGINNSALLTGTVNISISTNNTLGGFNGTAAFGSISAGDVCVDVLGNTVVQARTITGALNVVASSHTIDSYHTVMTWTPNGYLGIIPYLNGLSTYNTICIISNQGAGNAPVKFSVLSSESGANIAGLQNLPVATLSAGQTIRVDIPGSGQNASMVLLPYNTTTDTESAGTVTPLTGLQANDRFTGQFNISASPTTVTINCIQTDVLAGVKRAVPILQTTSGTLLY